MTSPIETVSSFSSGASQVASAEPPVGSDALLWHAVPGNQVLEHLQAPAVGLTTEDASERLARYGPNQLPPVENHKALKILLRQVHNPLIYVLLASTVLAMLTGKLIDGLVICGVVVLNALIGFVQEYRAGQAIQALSAMVPLQTTVLRDGQKTQLVAADLVPGDIVLLQAGDQVPADLRLLAVRNLKVEEATLTGESVPAEKSIEAVPEQASLGDRRGMVYSGTLVTYGTGTGVVVATGSSTELGRISRLIKEAADLATPLTRQLAVVGTWIAVAVAVVSVVLLGISLGRGYPLGDAILAAVTLAVAAIPEGLPAIVTIALAIGVQRMARRRAVIRKLPAVETLGSTTVICSDKTGTLTRNEMTVQVLYTPRGRYRLSGIGYAPKGELRQEDGTTHSAPPEAVKALAVAGVLCNDAALHRGDDGWQVQGDPTEGALVVAARKLELEAGVLRAQYRRLDTIPFESERQFMATLHETPEGQPIIYLKGAPEVVLRRCLEVNGQRSMEPILREVDRIAAQGMRVLAFAVRRVSAPLDVLDDHTVDTGFTFLGLQGMIDPPRAEAVAAVEACREAGILVKMITGDHPETARAIGESFGLARPGEPALTGADLNGLSEQGLREVVCRHHVFARLAPEHKLRLVQALQAEGHVVAMTGDGVNDAPALKQADLGIAMGITGTAVSKEAADMVLSDDNFASIQAAVEEGRRVYDNLIKALAFVLPTNLGLALILIAAVAFFPIVGGLPLLPMQPVQILWINLIAAVALALPLAFEVMEPDLMRRPPRPPGAPVLSRFVIGRTVVVALLMAAGAVGLFLYDYQLQLAVRGSDALDLARSQTVAVTTIVLFQCLYLLQCRSLNEGLHRIGLWSNPWIYLGIGGVLLLQAAFMYLPVMHRLFGSAPLDAAAWGRAVLAALIVLPVIALEKRLRNRRAQVR